MMVTSDIPLFQTMYESQHMPMTQLSQYCAPNTIKPNNSFNHIFTKFMNGSSLGPFFYDLKNRKI